MEPDSSPAGHQALDFDVGELQLEAQLTAQDDELAGDVHAREVIARIGLRVAPLARIADDVGERRAAIIDVEEIGERSREDPLDAGDLVSRLPEVTQGVHHRQSGTDRGFVEIVRAPGPACLVHGAVVGEVGAIGFLVGCDDVHAARPATRAYRPATSALAVQSMMTECGR